MHHQGLENIKPMPPTFAEFFAGAGMVRAALEPAGWQCVFANDIDPKKAKSYQANWETTTSVLHIGDVNTLQANAIPTADLIWGSFPCQDLSLAGTQAGLSGTRSGAFYPFWSLIQTLVETGRGPKILAIENVIGTLSAQKGQGFSLICQAFDAIGYVYGALIIDASLFVPQSRPRLFVIAVRPDIFIVPHLLSDQPLLPFHPPLLQRASPPTHHWWKLPLPPPRPQNFIDILEDRVQWHSPQQTHALLSMMSPHQRAKVQAMQALGIPKVGGIYKRTRVEQGQKYQRAEVRFDDIAGCLRTPAGGSSRQLLLLVEGERLRTRLISPRETARLMGLPDHYILASRANDSYHLMGDGVVVPVVQYLDQHLFRPLLA
jgi:DNA (cytosine-5)-methyltransferase 1